VVVSGGGILKEGLPVRDTKYQRLMMNLATSASDVNIVF
jgi:hypothetical protein